MKRSQAQGVGKCDARALGFWRRLLSRNTTVSRPHTRTPNRSHTIRIHTADPSTQDKSARTLYKYLRARRNLSFACIGVTCRSEVKSLPPEMMDEAIAVAPHGPPELVAILAMDDAMDDADATPPGSQPVGPEAEMMADAPAGSPTGLSDVAAPPPVMDDLKDDAMGEAVDEAPTLPHAPWPPPEPAPSLRPYTGGASAVCGWTSFVDAEGSDEEAEVIAVPPSPRVTLHPTVQASSLDANGGADAGCADSTQGPPASMTAPADPDSLPTVNGSAALALRVEPGAEDISLTDVSLTDEDLAAGRAARAAARAAAMEARAIADALVDPMADGSVPTDDIIARKPQPKSRGSTVRSLPPMTFRPDEDSMAMLSFPRPHELPASVDANGNHLDHGIDCSAWEGKAISPNDLWVKLSLTVCASGPNGQPVGLNVSDCGTCGYCLDKPRFGGKGTKRQKCVNKRLTGVGPQKAWCALRVVSKAHLDEIDAYASRPPPKVLLDASAAGPIPLVWAFPRLRRARPLPPAFVLMYRSDRHIKNFDRSWLERSLVQRAIPKRTLDKMEKQATVAAERAAAIAKNPSLSLIHSSMTYQDMGASYPPPSRAVAPVMAMAPAMAMTMVPVPPAMAMAAAGADPAATRGTPVPRTAPTKIDLSSWTSLNVAGNTTAQRAPLSTAALYRLSSGPAANSSKTVVNEIGGIGTWSSWKPQGPLPPQPARGLRWEGCDATTTSALVASPQKAKRPRVVPASDSIAPVVPAVSAAPVIAGHNMAVNRPTNWQRSLQGTVDAPSQPLATGLSLPPYTQPPSYPQTLPQAYTTGVVHYPSSGAAADSLPSMAPISGSALLPGGIEPTREMREVAARMAAQMAAPSAPHPHMHPNTAAIATGHNLPVTTAVIDPSQYAQFAQPTSGHTRVDAFATQAPAHADPEESAGMTEAAAMAPGLSGDLDDEEVADRAMWAAAKAAAKAAAAKAAAARAEADAAEAAGVEAAAAARAAMTIAARKQGGRPPVATSVANASAPTAAYEAPTNQTSRKEPTCGAQRLAAGTTEDGVSTEGHGVGSGTMARYADAYGSRFAIRSGKRNVAGASSAEVGGSPGTAAAGARPGRRAIQPRSTFTVGHNRCRQCRAQTDFELQLGMCPECALQYVLQGGTPSTRPTADVPAAQLARATAVAHASSNRGWDEADGDDDGIDVYAVTACSDDDDDVHAPLAPNATGASVRGAPYGKRRRSASYAGALEDEDYMEYPPYRVGYTDRIMSGGTYHLAGNYNYTRGEPPVVPDRKVADEEGVHRSTIWRRRQKELQARRMHRGGTGKASDPPVDYHADIRSRPGGSRSKGARRAGGRRSGPSAADGSPRMAEEDDESPEEEEEEAVEEAVVEEVITAPGPSSGPMRGRGRGRVRGRGMRRRVANVSADDASAAPLFSALTERVVQPFQSAKAAAEEMAADGRHLHVTPTVAALLGQLHCAVCLNVLDRTVAAPCMHRFCQECIEKWLRVGRRDCPECKRHVHSRRSFKRDERIDAMIGCLIAQAYSDPSHGHVVRAEANPESATAIPKGAVMVGASSGSAATVDASSEVEEMDTAMEAMFAARLAADGRLSSVWVRTPSVDLLQGDARPRKRRRRVAPADVPVEEEAAAMVEEEAAVMVEVEAALIGAEDASDDAMHVVAVESVDEVALEDVEVGA